jgi:hypothetical protein
MLLFLLFWLCHAEQSGAFLFFVPVQSTEHFRGLPKSGFLNAFFRGAYCLFSDLNKPSKNRQKTVRVSDLRLLSR